MRVIPLHRDSDTDYSCMVYWILGDNNGSQDRNTLIDTGSSSLANLAFFMREMSKVSKGMGKMAVEQVIITHEHYDHTGGMAGLITQFNPRVLSWLPLAGTTERLSDGMHLRLGDHDAVVLHTPGHSADSVCLFQADTGSLFSGDTLVSIHDSQGRYSQEYLESLLRLSRLDIRTIYPGHGPPISEGAMAYIRTCCTHVGRSLGTDPRADGQ